MRTFDLMEQVIKNQEADFISLCRPLIREPEIINRWRHGDRRRATCISCNRCFDATLKGEQLLCVQSKSQ